VLKSKALSCDLGRSVQPLLGPPTDAAKYEISAPDLALAVSTPGKFFHDISDKTLGIAKKHQRTV
jgi:hypothetical protein